MIMATLSYPIKLFIPVIIFHQVQLLNSDSSVAFECQLKEKALDPKGNDSRILPPYNAYSAPGEIEVSFIH